MKTLFITFIAAIAIVNVSYANERKRPPANVLLASVKFAPIEISIETVGTAEAIHSVSLYPAAADKVTKINFTPGDFVKKGTVLIELDARRQISALRRKKIELADSKRELDRLTRSEANGAITKSELDAARSLLELAHVNITEAQADLDDRQVVAPFDGHLGLTELEVGDRINESTLVTNIDDRQKLYINFSVPESAYELVNNNTEVTVAPWNSRGTLLNASLTQLDSRIDVDNRTLKVRAEIDNKDDKLRPGLSFKVNLTTYGEEYPIVPEASLAWGATGAYVWLAQKGKAVKKPVQIKQRLRGFILVEGNLSNNDTLIVEGIQRLREGAEVAEQPLVAAKD